MTKVLRATASSQKRWSVDLVCGHEAWVTASRAPKAVPCPWKCSDSDEAGRDSAQETR